MSTVSQNHCAFMQWIEDVPVAMLRWLGFQIQVLGLGRDRGQVFVNPVIVNHYVVNSCS